MAREEFAWSMKYRPKTVNECILPDKTKEMFESFVENQNVPNLILSGTPGIGKTTVAKAMLEQLDCNYIVINASLKGNIDTLRTEIMQFASTVSLTGGRKYVILDEAERLSGAVQESLRNFMEEYSRNCGFILTVNHSNRIIDALHSRCSDIEFYIDKSERSELITEFCRRVFNILEQENIDYDKKAVAYVIKKRFPDMRKCLNDLQRFSHNGTIHDDIIDQIKDVKLDDLIKLMKEKNYSECRKWVALNNNNDFDTIYRKLYDSAYEYCEEKSVPNLVLIVADYMYKAQTAIDQEVNLMACLTELMMEVSFYENKS